MTQLAVLKREAKSRRRAGVILTVAVIAAVVAAGGWFYGGRLIDSGDRTLPAGPTAPESAQNVARAFLQAYGEHDTDRAISYLTDEAIAGNWGSPAALRGQLAWDVAAGYQEVINHCDQQHDSGRGSTLRCGFDFHGIRSDELGFGPYRGNYWDLTVHHGRIVSADNKLNFLSNGFSRQMWEPFAAWVSTTYPRDAELMYTDSTRTLEQHTAESIALWGQHTRDYVAHELGMRRKPAAAYIARVEGICAAAHARVSDKGGTAFYDQSWGRILDQALVELRSVAPPEPVRTQFDNAYGLVAQLAEGMRSGRLSIDVLHRVESSGLGLQECTFHGPR